jgi:hypothetical protein
MAYIFMSVYSFKYIINSAEQIDEAANAMFMRGPLLVWSWDFSSKHC